MFAAMVLLPVVSACASHDARAPLREATPQAVTVLAGLSGAVSDGVSGLGDASQYLLHSFDRTAVYRRSFARIGPGQSPQLLTLWGSGTLFSEDGATFIFARWVPLRLERYEADGRRVGQLELRGERIPALDSLFSVETTTKGDVSSIRENPNATGYPRITGYSRLSGGRSLLSILRADVTELMVIDSTGEGLLRVRLPAGSWNHIAWDARTSRATVGVERGDSVMLMKVEVPFSAR